MTEPVTIAVETYIGGERVRVTVDGQALVSPTAGERFRRSAQRRFSSLRDLRNYVQRVHCRSARDEQFPRRGPARLIYGNSNSILLDNVKVSPDAKLAVYTSYSVGAFFDKRAINRQLIVCDSP